MRTINVRRKGTPLITEMFKFNGRDPEQVTLLATLGHICYANCLLMNTDIWNSTVAVNGNWAFWDGDKTIFVHDPDEFFEPPLAKYKGDSRTVKELWEECNGKT